MGPGVLSQVMSGLQFDHHPQLLVGLEQADDAAVLLLNPTQALVQTVDFFPPIVDDPYDFGYIAAVHAMSDIYAMGGTPTMALAIAAMPADLDAAVIRAIFQGGIDAFRRAGAVVAGGHTIVDSEPKFGYTVSGIVDPQQITRKRGVAVGDALLLSKPLGSGIVTTAAMRDLADADALDVVITKMKELNVMASTTALAHHAAGMTDVTGFGLVGHLLEMIDSTGLGVTINSSLLPIYPTALELAAAGVVSGGLRRNRAAAESSGVLTVDPAVSDALVDVCCDPQTSGGLLVAVPAADCASLQRAGAALGIDFVHIATVTATPGVHIGR